MMKSNKSRHAEIHEKFFLTLGIGADIKETIGHYKDGLMQGLWIVVYQDGTTASGLMDGDMLIGDWYVQREGDLPLTVKIDQ